MFRRLTLSNVTKQQSWVPAEAMSGTSSPRIPSRDMHGGTFCRGLRKSARYPETPRDLQLWVLLPPRLKGQGMWGLEPSEGRRPRAGAPQPEQQSWRVTGLARAGHHGRRERGTNTPDSPLLPSHWRLGLPGHREGYRPLAPEWGSGGHCLSLALRP